MNIQPDCRNNNYISLPPGGLDTNTHELKELGRWPTLHPRGRSIEENPRRRRRHADLYKAGNWITSIYGITDSRQDQGRYSRGIHSAWHPAMTPSSGCCRSPESAALCDPVFCAGTRIFSFAPCICDHLSDTCILVVSYFSDSVKQDVELGSVIEHSQIRILSLNRKSRLYFRCISNPQINLNLKIKTSLQ